MPGTTFIDPEALDDTELGAAVRDAYARGISVVALIPMVCPRCLRPASACETCPAAGEEE